METPILFAENISRSFQAGGSRIQALAAMDIIVQPHTLTVLKGRSGSGKTTLLNILGALDLPDTGRVLFGGLDITSLQENRRDSLRLTQMGFVFQSVALLPMLSAYENVEYALRLAGKDRRHWRARAEECLGYVGLKSRMKHQAGELSGGEQQRVAIARAIAHRPRVLFADEPTAELDMHMGLQVMKLFRGLVEEEGITIVMTTHDPNMMELADRVFVMDGAAQESSPGGGAG